MNAHATNEVKHIPFRAVRDECPRRDASLVAFPRTRVCNCCERRQPLTADWFTRRNGDLDRTCRACHRARQTRLRCTRGIVIAEKRLERLRARLAEAEARVGKRWFPW